MKFLREFLRSHHISSPNLSALSQPPVICVVSGMGIHLHEDCAGKVPSLRLLGFMVTWGEVTHGVTHGVIMATYFWLLKDTWSYLHLSTSWIAVNMSNSSSVDSWKTLRVQSIRFSFFWVCSPEKASTTWPGTFSFGTSLSSRTGHIHVSLLLIFQPLRICKLQDIAFETIPNAPRSECQEKLMANSLQHRC